jgi:heptosyltransferase-1
VAGGQRRLRLPKPSRILIVKPSSLGDIVQALPVLAALKEAFPTASVGWVVRDSYAPLLTGHPFLNELLVFRRSGRSWTELALEQLRLVAQLRAFRADWVCDLQGLARSAWMAWLTGAPVRVGMTDCREGARLAYTHVVRIPPTVQHAVWRYWLVAQALTGIEAEPKFVLPSHAEAACWAEQLVQALKGRPLLVAPGARWPTKRWLPERFAAVSVALHQATSCPVVLVGSDFERQVCAEVQRLLTEVPCENLAGRTSLPQLVELCRRAALVIGNDSGVLHTAAAVGTPALGIYTCTDPRRAAPFGKNCRAIASPVWCAGSYRRECPRMDCLYHLLPGQVVETALRLLHGARSAAA